MKTTFLFLVGTIAVAQAKCPEMCNQRGKCVLNDLCDCYDNYSGSSCAERVCPFSFAFGDIVDSSVTERKSHFYLECGGKGICDRNSGICECFEGYTGKGCKRSSCPKGCSGHGQCRTLGAVNSGYTAWDADKTQVCVCDPGYEGVDCGSRMCPVGDDPMTAYYSGTPVEDDVQTITVTGAPLNSGEQAVLQFTDYRGETWSTWPLDLDVISAISIEEALVALPNHAIPSVTVAAVGTPSTTSREFTVTFTDAENTGIQNVLVADTTACIAAGCHPVTSGKGSATIGIVHSTYGTREKAVCSNRGSCDSSTGLCACNEGFHGQSCELQTVIQ